MAQFPVFQQPGWNSPSITIIKRKHNYIPTRLLVFRFSLRRRHNDYLSARGYVIIISVSSTITVSRGLSLVFMANYDGYFAVAYFVITARAKIHTCNKYTRVIQNRRDWYRSSPMNIISRKDISMTFAFSSAIHPFMRTNERDISFIKTRFNSAKLNHS